MFQNNTKEIKIRPDLKNYFSVVSSEDSVKGTIKCLHGDCVAKNAKPRSFNSRTGWRSHIHHLESQHGILKESFLPEKNEPTTILNYLAKKKLQKFTNQGCYPTAHVKQVQFMTNISDLVCVAGAPLNLIENPIMMKLIRDLDKMVRLPSRRTVTRNIELEAKRIIARNKSNLCRAVDSTLHFSLDLWSSRSHKYVMGIRVHYIDDHWNLKSFCLAFLEYNEKKDANSIRQAFLSQVASRYQLKVDQVGFIMADNARENVSAFGDANTYIQDEEIEEVPVENPDQINWENIVDYDQETIAEAIVEDLDECDAIFDDVNTWASKPLVRIGCTTHALQLVIRECLGKNDTCKKIQKQVEQLVSFFNTSNFWNHKLTTRTSKGLIKIGDTRWNGLLLAIQRILEEDFIRHLNNVLEEAHGSNRNGRKKAVPELITPEREQEMKELSHLLTPFLVLTNELQAEGVTSSLVILGLITLYKQLAAVSCEVEYMRALRTSLCLTLVERFGAQEQFNYSGRGARKNLLRVFSNEAYVLATVLDPRWKLKPFTIPLDEPYLLSNYVPKVETAKKTLMEAYMKAKGDLSNYLECAVATTDANAPAKKCRNDFLSSFIPLELNSESDECFENEVEAYLAEPRCSSNLNPLEFWKTQMDQNKFPLLRSLAKKYLGFPASSSSLERVFSITGSLNRARRASLATSTMEDLLIYRESRREEMGMQV